MNENTGAAVSEMQTTTPAYQMVKAIEMLTSAITHDMLHGEKDRETTRQYLYVCAGLVEDTLRGLSSE